MLGKNARIYRLFCVKWVLTTFDVHPPEWCVDCLCECVDTACRWVPTSWFKLNLPTFFCATKPAGNIYPNVVPGTLCIILTSMESDRQWYRCYVMKLAAIRTVFASLESCVVFFFRFMFVDVGWLPICLFYTSKYPFSVLFFWCSLQLLNIFFIFRFFVCLL